MNLRPLIAIALVAVTAAAAASIYRTASADPAVDNVPLVFPYDGYIELDGQPLTGTLDMRFTLYDGTTNLWQETHAGAEAVAIYLGQFSVMLGETTDLTTAVLETEPLTVGIEISDDGMTWTGRLLLDAGSGRGYSCMTRIDATHVGIVYESSRADLVFQRVPVAAIR